MKSKKRLTMIVLACALIAAVLVGGTIAWLTDQDTKTNKIEIAKISTTPDEPNWPADPNNPDASVTVYPGVPQAKDPTVTVDADSEAAYVRVLVKISTKLLDQLDGAESMVFKDKTGNGTITGAALPNCNTGWTKNGGGTVDGDYTILEYRYDTPVGGKGTEVKLPAVFTGFKIKDGTTAVDLDGVDMDIVVVSQAIQAAGQADADTAFGNLGSVTKAFE